MTKRRRMLGLVAVAVVGLTLACLGLWWLKPSHRIDVTGLNQLRVGMTEKQVEAVFGVPPGDYATTNTCTPADLPKVSPDWRCERWRSDRAGVSVYFSPDGKVASYCIWPGTQIQRAPPTLLERVRSWLGL